MAIIDLPLTDHLDRKSGPQSEGFGIDVIRYDSKLSQRAFKGPDMASSREEVWKVIWFNIEYDKLNPTTNDLRTLMDFHNTAHNEYVRWTPFEFESARIFRIVPGSLRRKNIAGPIFEVSISLEFQYEE